MSFDIFFFLLIVAGLLAVRAALLPLMPWRPISIDTAVLAGFVLFFALPSGFGRGQWSDVSAATYALHIVLGYVTFCGGMILASLIPRRSLLLAPLTRKPSSLLRTLAAAYCLLYTILQVALFFSAGGVGRLIEVWGSGSAVFTYLSDIEAGAQSSGDIVGALPSLVYFICLGIIFVRHPWIATASWFVYLAAQLQGYMGRSQIAMLALVPWLCYLIYRKVKLRQILLQGAIVAGVVLVFFTLASFLRTGALDKVSLNTLNLQTLGDEVYASTSPFILAPQVLDSGLRGSGAEYLVSLVALPVPRTIWAGKPLVNFNFALTEQFTGYPIGAGNSIQTFTMLGEAWYYFGPIGSVVVMLLFGFVARLAERMLTRHPGGLIAYAILLTYSIIYIRSTFYSYWAYVLSILLTLAIVLIGVWVAQKTMRAAISAPEIKTP